VAFDPFLYVAFGAGLLGGVLLRPKSRWLPRATLASVVVLVGLLGAALDAVPAGALLLEIPIALGFALLVLGLTVGTVLAIARVRPPPNRRPGVPHPPERFPVSAALIAALVGGYALGHFVSVPSATAIPWALYALLFLVGLGLELHVAGLRELWVPIAGAVVGAAVAAVLFVPLARVPIGVSVATSGAFGFYSLAGPLVAARDGAVLGLLAFLTNFLRENLTMVLAPVVGRRLGGKGLTAMGGATAMDTTLYFVTRYGDAEAGSLAIASGLVLTIVATVLVPAALAL